MCPSMMGMTTGSDFFGHPKNHQKINPSKIFFFNFWAILGSPLSRFCRFWGSKRGPGRSIFNSFFHLVFYIDFLFFFAKKNKKIKIEKVGFDWKKPYYREGRHVQKKARMTGKKQRKKHRFFSQKSMKNRWKSRLQRPSQQKSKKWLPWDPHFPLKYNLWSILVYPGGAKNPPQGVRDIDQHPFL